MAEIRALIVDDEPLARRGIRQLLAEHPDVVVVGECRDGREALRALATLDPDLVFLDVQMPGFSGFDVIRVRGTDRMPAVVFVTAHEEYAVRAFEDHALDYLVKPVSAARFRAAMAHVRERLRLADAVKLASRLAALLAAVERAEPAPAGAGAGRRTGRQLVVPTATGRRILGFEEIDWIEARDYCVGVYARGERYIIRDSLAGLETRLDPGEFLRVHRSAIVRLDRIRELRNVGEEQVVVLRDGTTVPVSRRKRERLVQLLRHPTG
jgi:two-component system, LytTR family, response regulator